MFRLSLVLMVALAAAALGDTIVEWSANAGLFGAGYSDSDQRSVVPALVCAGVIGLQLVIARVVAMLRGKTPASARDVVLATASRLSRRSLLRDLPAICFVQLAGVYAMESAEAALRVGTVASGLGWLGGPVIVALAFHAVVCVLCILGVGALLRALVGMCASIVLRVLAVAYDIEPSAPGVVSLRARPLPRAAACASVRQRGKRAPPFLHVHS
jgi:hypothetical protein